MTPNNTSGERQFYLDWLGTAWLLALPIVFLILTQLSLRPRFPNTHALIDDWFAHSQYLAMFLFGADSRDPVQHAAVVRGACSAGLWPSAAELRFFRSTLPE